MEDNKLRALIHLLDDPDAEVFTTVREQLLHRGREVIDDLEQAWQSSGNEFLQERILNIIQDIEYRSIKNDLEKWHNQKSPDILTGATLLARTKYTDLRVAEIEKKLDLIKKDIWIELNDNLTALEKIKVLNHILFDIHKFYPDNSDLYNPQNNFINNVLDSKKGGTLSLAVLYLILARKLDLPVYGVLLPGYIILAYYQTNELEKLLNPTGDSVLFYINPFNKGAVFGRKEIDYYLKGQNLPKDSVYYSAGEDIEIIKRLFENTVVNYKRKGDTENAKRLNDLYQIFQSS